MRCSKSWPGLPLPPTARSSGSLLLAAQGLANAAIAAQVGVAPSSVVGWRERFAADGLAKFAQVRKGRGRKAEIPQDKGRKWGT